MLSFWSSLSASDRRDIVGLLLVAFGVAGELISTFDFANKLLGIRFNPTGFPPLDIRKKLLEIISTALIVIGLGLMASSGNYTTCPLTQTVHTLILCSA
jgi:hypothetical protein